MAPRLAGLRVGILCTLCMNALRKTEDGPRGCVDRSLLAPKPLSHVYARNMAYDVNTKVLDFAP